MAHGSFRNPRRGPRGDGYAVLPDAFAPEAVAALRERALSLDARGEFVAAGIGRGGARSAHSDIRGDRIRWLDPTEAAPSEAVVWRTLDALREALNRSLMLGLWRFEGHYALYSAGAFYARHRDVFSMTMPVPCLRPPNERWRAGTEALRLHLASASSLTYCRRTVRYVPGGALRS
jgi:SM-20-related protein